jgi:hypothetical protein
MPIKGTACAAVKGYGYKQRGPVMLASTWISEKFSTDLSEDQIQSILPELASILKMEMKVADVSITVGIQIASDSDIFDEIAILMITGEAA